ncbi:MAG: T9SS C-terminal target domain-containing protein [Candidatus Zixiibacteriota bacterium]|nr:MAG: T9SS C-terminal target domain-containing protein [candidate division Zixibacteria bacterium]
MKAFLALVCILMIATLSWAQLDLEITPDTPVNIPETGGWFDLLLSLENTTAAPVSFEAWIDVELPWGFSIFLKTPIELTVPGGFITSHELEVYVPSFAPAGEYRLTAGVGDYPSTIIDCDSLIIIKAGTDGLAGDLRGWQISGDFFTSLQPQAERLVEAFPNPFNPTTTLHYQLTAFSPVNLKVYDSAGREVAALVDGWREAGSHEVTFDASLLPSGTYFARLTAGEVTQVQKLILLK